MFNLFKSELRKKLLSYYFTNPEAVHYVRELARLLEVDATNLSRELILLQKQGIFISEKKGSQKYFYLNKTSPIFKELKNIISKTIGAAGMLKETFSKLADIDLAVLYGSFASEKQDQLSDIDVLVVGNTSLEKISDTIDKLEDRLKREINVRIYSPQEFLRKKNRDPFLKNVLENKYIILVGEL